MRTSTPGFAGTSLAEVTTHCDSVIEVLLEDLQHGRCGLLEDPSNHT